MNLTIDPWIPTEQGTVSLQDVFSPGAAFKRVEGSAPEKIAIYKLLFGIFARSNELGQTTAEYLRQYKDRFELFHPTAPFGQMASLTPAAGNSPAPIDKLLFQGGFGEKNKTFRTSSTVFSPSEAIVALLVFLNFDVGGTRSTAVWNDLATSKGAWLQGCCTNMVHTIAIGETLRQTIEWNTPDKTTYQADWGPWGIPTWESGGLGHSDEAASFMGRCLPMSRLCRLMASLDGVVMAVRRDYEKPRSSSKHKVTKAHFTVGVRDFLTTLGKNESGPHTVRCNLDRALWRNLPAVVQSSEKTGSPWGIYAQKYLTSGSSYTIWCGGLATDKGKVLDAYEHSFFVPECGIYPEARQKLISAVEYSEKVGNALDRAAWNYVTQYFTGSGDNVTVPPESQAYSKIRARTSWRFWTRMNYLGESLILRCVNREADAIWETDVRRLACETMESEFPHQTPRELKAFQCAERSFLHNLYTPSAGSGADTTTNATKKEKTKSKKSGKMNNSPPQPV